MTERRHDEGYPCAHPGDREEDRERVLPDRLCPPVLLLVGTEQSPPNSYAGPAEAVALVLVTLLGDVMGVLRHNRVVVQPRAVKQHRTAERESGDHEAEEDPHGVSPTFAEYAR